ncbi:unnamed protein product [Trichobilharzia regenti]|nr:unnamed protein product [Trichobilharzia regenti]
MDPETTQELKPVKNGSKAINNKIRGDLPYLQNGNNKPMKFNSSCKTCASGIEPLYGLTQSSWSTCQAGRFELTD